MLYSFFDSDKFGWLGERVSNLSDFTVFICSGALDEFTIKVLIKQSIGDVSYFVCFCALNKSISLKQSFFCFSIIVDKSPLTMPLVIFPLPDIIVIGVKVLSVSLQTLVIELSFSNLSKLIGLKSFYPTAI